MFKVAIRTTSRTVWPSNNIAKTTIVVAVYYIQYLLLEDFVVSYHYVGAVVLILVRCLLYRDLPDAQGRRTV